MSHLITNDNFVDTIDQVEKIDGLCIFIDIVDSTRMKLVGAEVWIKEICKTFSAIQLRMEPVQPLKTIGDELMYFIPESEIRELGLSTLSIFESLCDQLTLDRFEEVRSVRIGAAWCSGVYPITFRVGVSDYYGLDIDLCARLCNLAAERELIINEALQMKLTEDFRKLPDGQNFHYFLKLRGPWPMRIKGIEHYVNIFKIPCD
ncbi:MAG: hypothetical protein RL095_351 [Verrucomicrobiota bacterium]|jgi:class 3 adenylate cyclase